MANCTADRAFYLRFFPQEQVQPSSLVGKSRFSLILGQCVLTLFFCFLVCRGRSYPIQGALQSVSEPDGPEKTRSQVKI